MLLSNKKYVLAKINVIFKGGIIMRKSTILIMLFSIILSCGKTQEPTYEGKSLSAWISDLKDASTQTQEKAIEALIEIGDFSIPYMIKILKQEKDDAIKVQAAYILASIGKSTKDVVSTLIKTIKREKEESDLLFVSARALINIKPNAKLIIPDMVDLAKNGTQSQRMVAIKVLGEIGDEAKDDIIKLINEIKEKDKELAKELVKIIYEDVEDLDEGINQAWAMVSNQYQRRADLIPNLLETVKGYASHERDTFAAVIEAHTKAGHLATTPEILKNTEAFSRFQQVQGEISSVLSRLMAVADNYPQLKANKNFLSLQVQLEGTENRITVARKRYNYAAQQYNIKIENIPFVEIFNFRTVEFFEIKDNFPEVEF